MVVLYEEVEKKGTFQITGNLDAVEQDQKYMFSEYGEYEGLDEDAEMDKSQEEDFDLLQAVLKEGYDWKPLFDKIPRKANGTFAKNRQVIIAQAHSMSWECEESYGRRGPQLRLKTYSDTEARLEYDGRAIIEKY